MLQQSQFSMDSSGPGSIPLAVSARGGVPAPGAVPGVRGLCGRLLGHTSTLESCGLGAGWGRRGVCDMLRTFGCISIKINKSHSLREEPNTGPGLDKFCFLIM